MSRFANECLKRMALLTKQLETSLGPSTGDLQGRCGLHSGPVTAGVLRGEKARFQLFGDTMNTASRMESSGVPGRIHISQETATLLTEAGKAHWITARENLVSLKGKGELQTFFVSPRPASNKRSPVGSSSEEYTDETETLNFDWTMPKEVSTKSLFLEGFGQERMQRLVDWNVHVLSTCLVKLAAARKGSHESRRPDDRSTSFRNEAHKTCKGIPEEVPLSRPTQIVDEMTDIVRLPPFVERECQIDESFVPAAAKDQLRDFVQTIAGLYRDVPFHNFEHASHVTMSAEKLMKRILSPEGAEDSKEGSTNKARQLHEMTYGISSDPLLQFAVVFAALIHDVDHTGLTNKQLIDGCDQLAIVYKGKSVAEQNSVVCTWNLLMAERYTDLQQCIYSNQEEKQRFRQLVVNAVMATDIADTNLQTHRKNRWDLAFNSNDLPYNLDDGSVASDRKATIVLEHIMQASDVAHCMQHWLTFQKFNKRLFEERYIAWIKSSDGDDPSVNWYRCEIGFFDGYVIPLAQKLHECGVFGVTYHEYLSYAQQNRLEWERKGEAIVAEMLAECQKKYGGDAGRRDNWFERVLHP
jgi:3'5'-cyclic nucleotide phosphodiesterase/Adenylate and Guanylate cyclase catalytic domain